MNAFTGQSIYKPLDSEKKEIRLLEILPVPPTGRIYVCCRLRTVSLIDPPVFTALSYAWGDFSLKKTILLNDTEVQVGKNLAEALSRITREAQSNRNASVLWADALCINQDDDLERGQQVMLMGKIYSSATAVYAWMGAESWIPRVHEILNRISRIVDDAEGDTRTLDELGWLEEHPELCIQDMPSDELTLIPNHHWMALRDFADLPYWSRMWIFQEIVLSRHLFFLGATNTRMSDLDLDHALTCVDTLARSLGSQRKPDYVSAHMWTCLQRLQILNSSFRKPLELLAAKNNFKGFSGSERAGRCLLSAFGRKAQASDARDYYYSLRGVAELSLQPDYRPGKRVQQVCLEFVRAYLHATRRSSWALLFLHDAVGPNGASLHGLPSWAPCYHLEMGGRAHRRSVESWPDASVFDDNTEFEKWHPTVNPSTATLRVMGTEITTISLVSGHPSLDPKKTNIMSESLLSLVNRRKDRYITGMPMAVAFFRAHLGQAQKSYNDADYLVLVESLAAQSSKSDVETTRAWQRIHGSFNTQAKVTAASYPSDVSKGILNGLTRALALSTGRLVETTSGYIGSAPLETKIGDVVCFLQGLQEPVILRPSGSRYFFIGTCFMLGLMDMDGEARGLLRQGLGTKSLRHGRVKGALIQALASLQEFELV